MFGVNITASATESGRTPPPADEDDTEYPAPEDEDVAADEDVVAGEEDVGGEVVASEAADESAPTLSVGEV
jgi:hypothetical protein